MHLTRNLTVAATALALAVSPAAFAKKGEDNPGKGKPNATKPDKKPGKPPKKPKTYSVVLKGVVVASKEGAAANTVEVLVSKGNAHGRKLNGLSITFDLASAKLSVGDSNLDGVVNSADLLLGDKVVVKAKLPQRPDAEGTYPARQVVDQTRPAEDEDEDETPAPAPAPAV